VESSEEEKEKRGAKPIFNESVNDDEYIHVRLARFIRFFDKQKELNRTKEQILQYIIIGFEDLIPIINVVGIENLASNIASAIFGAIFGGTIAALTAVLQFEKYHEGWISFKRAGTKLSNEYYMWKNSSGPYAPEKEKQKELSAEKSSNKSPEDRNNNNTTEYRLALLVKRCEEIITSEAFDYVDIFSENVPTQHTRPNSPLTRET
jgi:Protein of unknown function (DUF4231)